jgi:hypothetical protein
MTRDTAKLLGVPLSLLEERLVEVKGKGALLRVSCVRSLCCVPQGAARWTPSCSRQAAQTVTTCGATWDHRCTCARCSPEDAYSRA